MNKLRLIIAREYLSIVGRKSFILMTLGMPLLIAGIIALVVWLAQVNNDASAVQQIAVIDETGRYAAALQNDNMYEFVAIKGDTVTNARDFYDKANGSINGVVVIPRDVENNAVVNIYSDGPITPALVSTVRNALTDTIQNARLAAKGIPDLQKIIKETSIDLDVRSVTWSEDGKEKESSTDIAIALGLILAFFTYTFVLTYGSMIMSSVIEEKTNRIVEVVVSSCRPFQLMLGKIIGVGLVGLTQMLIWVIMIGIISLVAGGMFGAEAIESVNATASSMPPEAMAATQSGMDSIMSQLSALNIPSLILIFILYFVGGYLLYSSLFAGLGSAVDQASDSSQFLMPVMIIMIIALYAGMFCADNPSGPTAFWCSMIPFTSPVVMMIRIPYGVPFWELALSIVLLFATALAIIWLSARIYRRGILHYGQKASFSELFKWMK